MHLSLRQKQSIYQHLAQLLRAGIALPAAVERLSSSSSGGPRKVLRRLRELLSSGLTVAESFAALKPAVGDMECTAIAALERSGRLDHGMQQLGDYFGAMETARKEVVRRSAYPLFLMHFGILAINAPVLFTGAGAGVYLRKTCFTLFVIYAIAAIIALAAYILSDLGAKNPAVDWVLHRIFFIGKIRRAFSLARFCSTYDMQLDSGVNVIDSLLAAGRASRSGRIFRATTKAVSEIKLGAQVGPQLARSRAFPQSFTQTFLVAEETGELDRALGRLSSEYQSEAIFRLSSFSQWLPQLLYVGIMLYFGWTVIAFYKGYFNMIEHLSSM